MLPFRQEGTLQTLAGGDVAGVNPVPLSIWALSGERNTARGEAYDWEGEAPVTFAEELAKTDRQLMVDGERYIIVSAVKHEILPHVALRLIRAGRRGGI